MKLTIIGAGPGGYVAALRAAHRGAQVTVVEAYDVGGTCLHWGCIPTKTLIASAEALERARRAADFGVEINGPVGYSLGKIRERKDKVVSTQVKGIRALFKSWGVNLIPARGSLLSPDVVRAVQEDGTTQDIKSDRVIIATGSRPASLPGFPFDGERVMTSDDAVRLTDVPKILLIVGAGVIGCEFAFIYRALGCEVTLVEMMPRALSTEDPDMSELIERELKKTKIKLITKATVQKIDRSDGGIVSALSNGQSITSEKVLVSIGRRVNSENLGLDHAGVALGKRGEIIVNERMETSAAGVYAVGDVTGKVMLAHVASRQGLIAVENALGGSAAMDYGVIPSGIFTMPEVGSVGIREQQAQEQGIAVKVGRFPYRALGKSHAMGEITGLVKVIADVTSDKILGVHICGAHATDIIHEAALAMTLGATARDIGRTIHAHPTLSEALMEACEDVHGAAIHVPRPGR